MSSRKSKTTVLYKKYFSDGEFNPGLNLAEEKLRYNNFTQVVENLHYIWPHKTWKLSKNATKSGPEKPWKFLPFLPAWIPEVQAIINQLPRAPLRSCSAYTVTNLVLLGAVMIWFLVKLRMILSKIMDMKRSPFLTRMSMKVLLKVWTNILRTSQVASVLDLFEFSRAFSMFGFLDLSSKEIKINTAADLALFWRLPENRFCDFFR